MVLLVGKVEVAGEREAEEEVERGYLPLICLTAVIAYSQRPAPTLDQMSETKVTKQRKWIVHCYVFLSAKQCPTVSFSCKRNQKYPMAN